MTKKQTFAEAICDAIDFRCKGQLILAVRFPPKEWAIDSPENDYSPEKDPRNNKITAAGLWNKTVPSNIASKYLDYDFKDGFGARDFHPLTIYTQDFVLTTYDYDGFLEFIAVERNFTLSQ